MFHKLLILMFLMLAATGLQAQDTAAAPTISPLRAALDQARQHVRDGDKTAAVEVLQGLADGGFTAVGVITGDAELATLDGVDAYDDLVAAMSKVAYPCEHDTKFQEFDFWIGEWDVQVANGTPAGQNVITSEQRGCVLIENWASATGGTGTSINYLDESKGEWVQIWNDGGGNQINIRGGLTDDGMLLVGTIHYVANDATYPFRGLWTPLPDGRVRQFFEQSNDDGETWSVWFEGFYSRQSVAQQ